MDAKAKVVAYYSPITNHVVRDQPNSVYIPLVPKSSLDELRAEYEQLHRVGVQMVKDYEVVSTRLVSLLTGLEALAGVAREVLARDNGYTECPCINHSRKAEREYESGTCPHQRLRELLRTLAAAVLEGK